MLAAVAELRREGRLDLAEALAAEAARAAPEEAEAHELLGVVHAERGHLARALARLGTAAGLAPDRAGIWRNLAQCLVQAGRHGEAAGAFRRSLALEPDDAPTLGRLGLALGRAGRTAEAEAALAQAMALAPDMPEHAFNLSLMRLKAGRLVEGWPLYEARWESVGRDHRRTFPGVPRWRGEAAAGASILIYPEQGFGDAIQFVRYVPLVRARGLQPVLECHGPLLRLFASLTGGARLIRRGDPHGPLAFQVPLLSLPLAFATTLESIPGTVPYLHADPALVAGWRRRLGEPAGLRVALVAGGNPDNPNDALRSIDPAALRPLARLPGVAAFLVRKVPAAPLPDGLAGIDLGPDDDFASTAALFSLADLVISVDTASAHLAGALGRPVWTLLPAGSDWRWLEGRLDSPWYPTMRLFRQERADDWPGVIRRVAPALALLAAQGRRQG
jgi:hypothetical protein